jgi:hypothetical protein
LPRSCRRTHILKSAVRKDKTSILSRRITMKYNFTAKGHWAIKCKGILIKSIFKHNDGAHIDERYGDGEKYNYTIYEKKCT